MLKFSRRGHSYQSGKALSLDIRSTIIDKIRGGNMVTGYIPGRYVDIANELNLSSAEVSKIEKQFYETNYLSPLINTAGETKVVCPMEICT
jgi:hypothetical protein